MQAARIAVTGAGQAATARTTSHQWAINEPAAMERIVAAPALLVAPPAPGPSPAEVRAWARANGIAVPDRGRLPDAVRQACLAAHDS